MRNVLCGRPDCYVVLPERIDIDLQKSGPGPNTGLNVRTKITTASPPAAADLAPRYKVTLLARVAKEGTLDSNEVTKRHIVGASGPKATCFSLDVDDVAKRTKRPITDAVHPK